MLQVRESSNLTKICEYHSMKNQQAVKLWFELILTV